jgi:hypothetical protein
MVKRMIGCRAAGHIPFAPNLPKLEQTRDLTQCSIGVGMRF